MKAIADIDVIIVNYNSGAALSQCLQTLLSESAKGLNVWLVDNHSSDDSLQSVPAHPNLTLIQNQQNVGFAQACNQAASLGKAPLLAIVNPDCFVQAEQLSQLAESIQNDESVALVGCRVLNEDGSLQAASRRRLPTFWRVVFHVTGLSRWGVFTGINIQDSGQFDHVKKVEAVNGACFVVRRSQFESINGFDQSYPLHFEDLDLFARLQQAGGQIMYHSDVTVTHLKGHSSQDSKRIKAWKKTGLLRYFNKHRPQWEAFMVKILLALR